MAQKLNVDTSIVDYLKSIGKDSSYSARTKLAQQYGINNYTGSAQQNISLLKTLKSDTKPAVHAPKQTAVTMGEPVEKKQATIPFVQSPTVSKQAVTQSLSQPAPNAANSAYDKYNAYEQTATPTAYQSPYGTQIDTILNQIMNRGSFSYNPATDPTYQSYSQQYQKQADLGMRDAMGQAAALTGGYGTTYGAQVGQQTYDAHMTDLNNLIPELYNAALARYQSELSNDYNRLGALQSLDNTSYGQYRDSMNDYYTNRDYYYGQYRDTVGDDQWQQQFDTSNNQWQQAFDRSNFESDRGYDYQVGRDAVTDQQWKNQFDHNASQDTIANNQWQQQFNRSNFESDRNYSMDSLAYLDGIAREQSQAAAVAADERIKKWTSEANNMLNATNKVYNILTDKYDSMPKYTAADVYAYLDGSGLDPEEIAIIVNGNYELRKYAESLYK